MCGIAGIFNFSPNFSQDTVVRKMTNCMTHRGPDAFGFFTDKFVGLGHRRLSIIDLSASSNQPFIDPEGRFVLVFNGELYNYREIRKELSDYTFLTEGDSETLIAAFRKWGPDCIKRFKGMFAFAMWDKVKETLYLFRDRMGVKPLYFYFNDKAIIFSSEIRSLLSTGLISRKLNKSVLPDFFSFQSFGIHSSPIEGIEQVDAGTYLTISRGKIEKTVYWFLGDDKPDHDFGNISSTHVKIRKLLRTSVESRLVSDVPVGAFLSGGIDSSIIVGLMSEISAVPPSTFNISFSEKEYDESVYAGIIANKFKTSHTTIKLSPHIFIDELENAMESMDSPSADGLNTFVVSKAIRENGLKVAISGLGGDELFARYPFYNKYLHLQKNKKLFENTFILRKIAASLFQKRYSSKNHRIASLLSSENISIHSIYPEFRRIISPELIRDLTNLNWDGNTSIQNEIFRFQHKIGKLPFLSQVSAAEYLGYTQHTLLKDTDQMSMAVSLEVREPFFDHELVNFMLYVPDKIKIREHSKPSLIECVMPELPAVILRRKKQGFLFPWQLWMKNELRSFCEKRIALLSQREFINGEGLKKYWKRFLENDPAIRWTEIWLFIVLEYWMDKNSIDE